ncbi:cell wall-binding repeat-containing protein, partial [Ilumatobacter sp.]|uniref:cell wall-binding repeat-containing protein n=1 Tax=Ilumatobacter sp. TaxID=1967498 RepID=UPI003C40DC51
FGRSDAEQGSASLVNFIAAYGTHPTILEAETLTDKRIAAEILVYGNAVIDKVDRLAGLTRYSTAAAISQSNFAGEAPVVYIAHGNNFPDALAGGPAAAPAGGPLLLVDENAIPRATALELFRLNPQRIVVLGGTNVITSQVFNSLQTYTTGTVDRLAGPNRYATAAEISQDTYPDGADTVFISAGTNYPDALGAGPAAAQQQGPLLMVQPGNIPAVTADELDRLNPTNIVVVGGPSAVSESVATDLEAFGTVTRLSGENRYQTAVAVSQAYWPDNNGGALYITTGSNFPDALSASAVAGVSAAAAAAGENGSPILLVPGGGTLPQSVADEIQRINPDNVYIVGGPNAVNQGIEDAIAALFPPPQDPEDRADFMNSTGAWANVDGVTTTGLDDVDFWIGGLAERVDPFGALLGPTFNFVFENQLEALQFGDRFYYLFRNQGEDLFEGLEANSFSSLIQRNTEASLLPAEIFRLQEPVLDMEALPTPLPPNFAQVAGVWTWDGDEHVEIHGNRVNPDNISGGEGDDALFGYGGNDRIEGRSGADSILGGQGDDILTDSFGDDNIKGGDGNDAIQGGPGIDLLLGGRGDDFITKTQDNSDGAMGFAGLGDDIILGGTGRDNPFGNYGDDWIEGREHADLLIGDNGQQFQNDVDGGDDVLIGGAGNDDLDAEGGDDILVGTPGGTDRFHAMYGWDVATYYGTDTGVDADLNFNLLQPPDITAIRDRYLDVEALSGGAGDDILRGLGNAPDDFDNAPVGFNKLSANADGSIDTQIVGLEELLRPDNALEDYALRFLNNPLETDNDGNSNLLMGGPGSDLIEGRFGDDFISGDAYLRVQLEHNGVRYDSAAQIEAGIFNGTINPGDVDIVREIAYADDPEGTIDTAVYADDMANYTIEGPMADGNYRVAHTGVAELEESEGVDILHGIEVLQFSGGCLILETMEACVPAGTITLEGQIDPPTEDQSITATVNFDPAVVTNPTQITFNWQNGEVGEEWEPSATASPAPIGNTQTFTPGDADALSLLRVVVTFLDDDGNLRSIASEALAEVVNVNDVPSAVTFNNPEPLVGQSLVPGPFTDGDGTEDAAEAGINYTYEASADGFASFTVVATTSTPGSIGYIVQEADAGTQIRVRVNFTDDLGTAEEIISAPSWVIPPLAVGATAALNAAVGR